MDKRNDPRYNFDANPTLDELIAQQGKGPVTDARGFLARGRTHRRLLGGSP